MSTPTNSNTQALTHLGTLASLKGQNHTASEAEADELADRIELTKGKLRELLTQPDLDEEHRGLIQSALTPSNHSHNDPMAYGRQRS
jgi:hypothetical protein